MLLLGIAAPLHVATKLLLRRSRWPKRFLAGAAWIIGARIRLSGERLGPHTLIVANHTSWLDILVLGGSTGCTFVSKHELGHPLFHWLADQNSTVYVKRTHVKGARDQAVAVGKALENAKPVTIFPEGTTGPGTHLLPFRSTLLEAANLAAKDIKIRPAAVDYGEAAAEIGWWHENGRDNILRLLGRRGTLAVNIQLLPTLDPGGHRKHLSARAREQIAEALGFKSSDHSPIDIG